MKITLGIFRRNGKPHSSQSSRNKVRNPAAELACWVIQGPSLLSMPLLGRKLRLVIVVTPKAGGLCCHLSRVHLAFPSQVAHFWIEVPHSMPLTGGVEATQLASHKGSWVLPMPWAARFHEQCLPRGRHPCCLLKKTSLVCTNLWNNKL